MFLIFLFLYMIWELIKSDESKVTLLYSIKKTLLPI